MTKPPGRGRHGPQKGQVVNLDKLPSELKILIVDSNSERTALIKAGLSTIGEVIHLPVGTAMQMSADVARLSADVVIVACDSPDRDTLESIREINADHPRPIVMFVERSDPRFAEEAIKAGVSAYIVEGLSANRVRPILEVAISRFKMFQGLQEELEKAKSDLTSRKVIEQAKGFLMKQNGLSESDAYNSLRRSAMTEGKTILEIANAVVAVARLLKT